MSSGFDAIVCGGGVIGAAVAYYLAGSGLRPLVVESQDFAHGASGFAAGILSPPLTDDLMGPGGGLQQLSFDLHRELAQVLPEKSGIDYEFAVTPMVNVAFTDEEEQLYRLAAERLAAAGGPFRWVAPDELGDVCPWIDSPVRGGLYEPHAAQVDPALFTRALLKAAEKDGAVMRIGRVTGLMRTGDRVVGALVDGQPVHAGAVVLAMGPWTREAGEWLEIPVPVEPLKGQIVHLRMRGAAHWSGFADADGDYLLPKRSGLVYVGTTEERTGFDNSTTPAGRDLILRSLSRLCSAVAEAEVVAQTACLRPLSVDGLPLLGPVPGATGAYLATGHGRSGILLAPGSGKALAEIITSGRSGSLNLSPFDPARFAV